jgi:hypothetical protein
MFQMFSPGLTSPTSRVDNYKKLCADSLASLLTSAMAYFSVTHFYVTVILVKKKGKEFSGINILVEAFLFRNAGRKSSDLCV